LDDGTSASANRLVMRMNRRTLLAASGALLGSSLLKTAGVENAEGNGTQLKSASGSTPEAFNLFDFEGLARQRIPHAAYEYIAGHDPTLVVPVIRHRQAAQGIPDGVGGNIAGQRLPGVGGDGGRAGDWREEPFRTRSFCFAGGF